MKLTVQFPYSQNVEVDLEFLAGVVDKRENESLEDAIKRALVDDIDEQLMIERPQFQICGGEEDAIEKVRAFIEERETATDESLG